MREDREKYNVEVGDQTRCRFVQLPYRMEYEGKSCWLSHKAGFNEMQLHPLQSALQARSRIQSKDGTVTPSKLATERPRISLFYRNLSLP